MTRKVCTLNCELMTRVMLVSCLLAVFRQKKGKSRAIFFSFLTDLGLHVANETGHVRINILKKERAL